ncbi:MAG: M1 family aminopeptidase [Planctomycetota bacterium]
MLTLLRRAVLAGACCAALAAPAGAQGLDSALGHRNQPLGPDSRAYDQQHLALTLTMDFGARTVSGSALHTLLIRRDGTKRLRFHSKDTTINEVVLEGAAGGACTHALSNGILTVTLPRALQQGETATLRISYVARPTRGLYFFQPTREHPEIPTQLWTQGQGQDNRHWIPCYDLPDDRLTTALTITVPGDLKVISNGRPAAAPKRNADGTATHLWVMDQRHVSYLISVIAGTFDTLTEHWEGIPLEYNVPPGQKHLAKWVFGRTPEMMQFFSTYTGKKHVWPRYAQTCVWDFLYGGMENTGATTLNTRAMHSEAASPSYSADGLIAHELAHMWYGDLLTCKTFQHIWLNEGFATYFTDLWFEHQRGAADFAVIRQRSQQRYIRGQDLNALADAPRIGRHIPQELSGGKAYVRGALVLHQLRHELGDDLFRAGIRRWTKTAADSATTSEGFRRSMEATAGRSLRWFWDQWVYGAGFPKLAVQIEWDEAAKELVWRVQQQQPVRGNVHLFRFSVDCSVGIDGQDWRERIEIHAAQTEWRVPLPERPKLVRFNEGGALAADITVDMAEEWWTGNLRGSTDVCARLDSVAHADPTHWSGLASCLAGAEPHWAVREAAVQRLQALWNTVDPEHRTFLRGALITAASDTDSRVRVAACKALGVVGRDGDVEALLLARLRSDPKEFVKAAACEGLSAIGGEAAIGGLREALAMDSYRDEVRIQALKGLARHAPQAAGKAARPFVDYKWGKGGQHRLRQAALDVYVAAAGKEPANGPADQLLIRLTADPYHRMRGWAIGHLRTRYTPATPGVADLLKALQRVARDDHVGGNRNAANAAIKQLTGAKEPPATATPRGTDERVAKLLREAERLKIAAERLLLEAKRLELEAREAKLGK